MLDLEYHKQLEDTVSDLEDQLLSTRDELFKIKEILRSSHVHLTQRRDVIEQKIKHVKESKDENLVAYCKYLENVYVDEEEFLKAILTLFSSKKG